MPLLEVSGKGEGRGIGERSGAAEAHCDGHESIIHEEPLSDLNISDLNHIPPPFPAIGLTSEDFKNILITSAGELPALFVALAGMELIGRRSTIAIALGGCALATALLTTDPSGSYFTALMFSGR